MKFGGPSSAKKRVVYPIGTAIMAVAADKASKGLSVMDRIMIGRIGHGHWGFSIKFGFDMGNLKGQDSEQDRDSGGGNG